MRGNAASVSEAAWALGGSQKRCLQVSTKCIHPGKDIPEKNGSPPNINFPELFLTTFLLDR